MSSTIKQPLSTETVEALQDLIQANIDSAGGYSEAAKQVEQGRTSAHLAEVGRRRLRFASELQILVQYNGVRPVKDGSWLAALQGTWLALKANLVGLDAVTVLRHVDQSEEVLEQAYQDAITHAETGPVKDRLLIHHALINRDRERICGLFRHAAVL